VLVVPDARAAHRQELTQRMSVDDRRRLTRRHRVRTLLTCYSFGHLVRVVPQALLLAVAEAVFALVTGHLAEARAILGAWTSNLASFRSIRARRKALKPMRKVRDRDVRRLQVRGSARVSAYLRGQITGGDERFQGVSGVGRSLLVRVREPGAARTLLFWIVMALVLVAGSRHLITQPIPAFGELVDFPHSSSEALAEARSDGSLAGLGGDTAPPASLAATGLLGYPLLGQMGLLRTLVVLGTVVVGLVGAWRLARATGSRRAQMAAVVASAAAPVGFNAVGEGHLSGLAAFAVTPFVLVVLARSIGAPPYAPCKPAHGVVALGLLLAGAGLISPVYLVMGPVLAIALGLGSMLAGQPRGAGRGIAVSFGGALLAALLLLPWSGGWIDGWDTFIRPRQSPIDPATAAELLRFDTGPLGAGPLGYLLLGAAALPLLVGRDWRLSWAVRGWMIAVVSWGLAFAATQGWWPEAAPPLEVLVAPAGAGLALAVAMGVAAFEVDLRDFHFGWRQGVSVLAGLALAIAVLPVLGVAVVDGRWGGPSDSLDRPLAFVDAERSDAPFRTVWIGDPEVLPLSGWTFDDAATYQVTSTGLPALRDLYPGEHGGTNAPLPDALEAAADGTTARLGADLAPYGVRYLFLPLRKDPGSDEDVVPDSPLVEALPEQLDLAELDVSSAVRVWENTAWRAGSGDVPSEAEPTTAGTVWLVLGCAAWLVALVVAVRTRGAVALAVAPAPEEPDGAPSPEPVEVDA
jgi:hypothetical protein